MIGYNSVRIACLDSKLNSSSSWIDTAMMETPVCMHCDVEWKVWAKLFKCIDVSTSHSVHACIPLALCNNDSPIQVYACAVLIRLCILLPGLPIFSTPVAVVGNVGSICMQIELPCVILFHNCPQAPYVGPPRMLSKTSHVFTSCCWLAAPGRLADWQAGTRPDGLCSSSNAGVHVPAGVDVTS